MYIAVYHVYSVVITIIPIFIIDLNQKFTFKKYQIDRKIVKKGLIYR